MFFFAFSSGPGLKLVCLIESKKNFEVWGDTPRPMLRSLTPVLSIDYGLLFETKFSYMLLIFPSNSQGLT